MGQIDYNLLNSLLNEAFFDGRFANRPVYIDLESSVLRDLSAKLVTKGFDLQEEDEVASAIGRAVYAELDLDDTNIYVSFKEEANQWRKMDSYERHAPPFTALLVALSLAAERMKSDADTSSTNYYIRLAEVLSSAHDEELRNRLSHSGKYTQFFWARLNEWLVKNEYKYGMPTAKSFGKWTYVSLAMSQSLVRDADREKLHRMFLVYGFSPSEQVSHSEMAYCLSEWLEGPYGNGWLAHIWLREVSARERIVSAARDELASWDGTLSGNAVADVSQGQHQKMFWIAYRVQKSRLAQASINLTLATKNIACVGAEFSNLIKEKYTFKQPLGADFAALTPLSGVMDASSLFSENLQLTRSTGDFKLFHAAKPIVILAKKEDASYYQEVMRISLHVLHLVICYSSWEERVKKYLDEYADPIYKKINSDNVNGLPDGWTIFQGVKIAKVDRSGTRVADDLESLVPLLEGIKIDTLGGIRFNANMWHGMRPPEILVSGEDGMLSCEIKSDEETHIEESGVIASSYLRAKFLNQNKIFHILAKGKNESIEKVIILKDSDTPDYKHPGRVGGEVAFAVGNDVKRLYGYSAESSNNLDAKLRGHLFSGPLKNITYNRAPTKIGPIPERINLSEETEVTDDDVLLQRYQYGSGAINIHECITKGNHVWMVDQYKTFKGYRGFTYTAMPDDCKMICSQCGAKMLVSTYKLRKKLARRGGGGRNRFRGAQSFLKAPQPALFTGSLAAESRPSDVDELLDALCYMGGGGLSQLQSVISAYTENPLEIYKVTNLLSDLGYLDLHRNNHFGSVKKWEIAPAIAVESCAGYYYLSGFRNPRLIASLEERLRKLGSSLIRGSQVGAPTMLKWSSDIDICDVLDGLKDSLGREIEFVGKGVSTSIASVLTGVGEIQKFMENVAFGDSVRTYSFDLHLSQWVECDGVTQPGAYKAVIYGTTYFYFDGDKYYSGPHEIVKILAARNAGIYLHSYSPATNTFESIMGAEPPGLLRRALIACSGLAPIKELGRVKYVGVDQETAVTVFEKIYG